MSALVSLYAVVRPSSSTSIIVVHTLNIFCSETAGAVEVKFPMELLWNERMQFVQMVQVTWPRWPPCPYMKHLKIFFSGTNQKSDDHETWFATWSTGVLPSLFKWWPWVHLDLFYSKVKFDPLSFCMGKSWNNGFLRNYCSLWYQSW